MLKIFVYISKNHLLCSINKRKQEIIIMKRIVFALLTIVVLGIVSSCASNQNCAAYGEKQRYQIERR